MYQNIIRLVFLTCLLLLIGCYSSGQRSVYTQGLRYQYATPKNYCAEIRIEEGFALFCPEGKIAVEFKENLNEVSPDSYLDTFIEQVPGLSQYSAEGLDGKESLISLAKFEVAIGQDKDVIFRQTPKYIAGLNFGKTRLAIVKGYYHHPKLEEDFDRIFLQFLQSLSP